MKEIWKELEHKGYHSKIYISNLGNVKRIYGFKKKERIVRPTLDYLGRKFVKIPHVDSDFGNYKYTTVYLHLLVAKYFVKNPNGYKRVVFLDGDRTNCRATNLRWTNSMPKLAVRFRPVRIKAVRLSDNKIINFNTISDASKKLRILQPNISNALRRRSGYTHGFIFEKVL